MATITASHFVSHVCGGATSAESKVGLSQLALRSQAVTHNGLRPVNKIDMLQLRTSAKVTAKKPSKNGRKIEAGMPAGTIVCKQQGGMNLIFVGCEVGPWCKTGGLGDVLGGLPPALAVSCTLHFISDAFPTTIVLFNLCSCVIVVHSTVFLAIHG